MCQVLETHVPRRRPRVVVSTVPEPQQSPNAIPGLRTLERKVVLRPQRTAALCAVLVHMVLVFSYCVLSYLSHTHDRVQTNTLTNYIADATVHPSRRSTWYDCTPYRVRASRAVSLSPRHVRNLLTGPVPAYIYAGAPSRSMLKHPPPPPPASACPGGSRGRGRRPSRPRRVRTSRGSG